MTAVCAVSHAVDSEKMLSESHSDADDDDDTVITRLDTTYERDRQQDGRTGGQTDTARGRACAAKLVFECCVQCTAGKCQVLALYSIRAS